MSWKGSKKNVLDKTLNKENSESLWQYMTVTKVGKESNWSSFSSFGSNVELSSVSALPQSESAVVAWTENNGLFTKYVKRSNGTYSAIQSISPSGKNVILSNGNNDFSNIKAMVYKTYSTAPYEILKSSTSFSAQQTSQGTGALAKDNSTDEITEITYGRSGVISKNGVEFVFAVGNITLGEEKIMFKPFVDTIPITNISELNERLRTNSFKLNGNSTVYLSNYYYSVRPSVADTALSETDKASFRLELVEEKTNKVISILDKGSFDKFNLNTNFDRSYELSCQGISEGDYYLRIVIESEGIESCNLNDIYYQADELNKEKYTKIGLSGETSKVTEYALENNYPNPFNPSTKINFQLPESGLVTLKVFDMLGQEVATLVNEVKDAGRHSATFNASHLSSGTYIYEIKVNDFRKTQKMMLVK